MATIDLGKIKQVFRGTYNNATAYVPDDLVVFTDTGITSTYICTTASTGNNPSSGGTAHANWAYVAKGVADPIPSQSGQSGKFLKTNGSALSFDTVTVPSGERLGGAWVKYRHDATINESYNVSSVTDNGEGEQTVNFSTSCSNNHYAVAAVCTYPSGTNSHFVSLGSRNQGWNANAQNTGSCKLWTIYTESSGNAQDVERIHAIFMGDWS